MKWILAIVVVSLVLGSIGVQAQGTPTVTITNEFEWIRQGQAQIVRVEGANIAGVEADFAKHHTIFFPDPRPEHPGAWIGILAAHMRTSIEYHPVTYTITFADGTILTIEAEIRVAHGEFARQDIVIPTRKVHLLKPAIQNKELGKLDVLTTPFRPERDWATSYFIEPTGDILSYFGLWRFFNNMATPYRHTGVDYVAGTGDRILAVADGVVAFAGVMDIRGNYVLIDHGWGIYSGYAHASELLVKVGDRIEQGDVIALVGDTGRGTGPHLHFEMMVNSIFVQPLLLMTLLNTLSAD